ncbi:MAG TPA: hypothetical protein VGA37_01960 [Gemmatimonadales bacterium]
MRATRILKAGLAVAALVAAVACQPDSNGLTDIRPHFNAEERPPTLGKVTVCKVGTDAEFSVTVGEGTSTNVYLAEGTCAVVSEWVDVNTPQEVTVTEINLAGTQLDSIVKDSVFTTLTDPPTFGTITWTIGGTNTAVGTQGGGKGTVLTFFNSRMQQAAEGCTPGYWKQPQHFDSWTAPYTPGMLFSDVFDDAFSGKTLLDVLRQGGGGLNALGRHTVAALLNAASGVNSGFTVGDVINAFNAVYPGSDYEGQKNIFEASNEAGCPLN